MSTLRAPVRVLPTLNDDGTRRWIRPRLFQGRFYKRRRALAWALMALFTALPFVRIAGKPAILLDVVHRQFTVLGRTFLPTDGALLMLLLLSIFVGIMLMTAVAGRVWCGWACPQTVYMEFLFRPIERLIDGDLAARRKGSSPSDARRVLKHATFFALSAVVANVFLSYFVGTSALAYWIRSSPFQHPTAFLVMGTTTLLVFFDFAYFREQMCTVACPYARLQSALLDKKSLVVAYDTGRGEPRGKKGHTTGDCVDCKMCVAACPTGIDIRNGLQLECIGCTQCIDACDGVMDKIGRPRGLIRYTSDEALAKKREAAVRPSAYRFRARSLLRPRVLVYVAVLLALMAALTFAARQSAVADVSVLRGLGEPFVVQGDLVQNHVRIKIENRTSEDQDFTISVLGASDARLVSPENPLHVAPRQHSTAGIFVLAPRQSFHLGRRDVKIRVSNGAGFERVAPYRLLGPEG
ncbi:MAG TPA: cytochrome c oxidase accessory protein CcoG [Polyangiaceae bacterium]|nr:cytochrome c oxidase accessory protein CcoG [Polyangiaceae bacterium]